MKKQDVIKNLPLDIQDEVRHKLKNIRRKHIYLIHNFHRISFKEKEGTIYQVVHFYKKYIVLKKLTQYVHPAHTLNRLLYRDISRYPISFQEVPYIDLPLYINQGNTHYKNLLKNLKI